MLPYEILEIGCSEVGPEDKSRAVVAIHGSHSIASSKFLLVHMHLLSQLTSNFHERKNTMVRRTAGGVTDGEIVRREY